MVILHHVILRPNGATAWSKFHHIARWTSTSTSTQVLYIKKLRKETSTVEGHLTEINGYSSDIRARKIGDSLYLVPEYTIDPAEALTSVEFEKPWWGKKRGELLLARTFEPNIYMVSHKDPNNRHKMTEAALWKSTIFGSWKELEEKKWGGHSNELDQDLSYLYVVWRTELT